MAQRTISQSVAPIAIVSRIFFTAPFVKTKNNVWRVSRPLSLIGLAVQVSATLLNVYYLAISAMAVEFENDAFLAISFMHQVLMQLHRLVNCLNSFYQYGRVAELLNSVQKLSEKMHFDKRYSKFMLTISWLQIISMCPLPIFFSVVFISRGGASAVPYALLQACAVGAINMQEVQGVNCLAVAQGFVRNLQKRLLEFRPDYTSKTGFKGSSAKNHLLAKGMFQWKTKGDEILEIRELYRETWELKMKINNVYSVQLFACINHTFMQLIFYAFLNFTINADLEVSSTILNRPRMVSIKAHTIFLAAKIIWMVSFCHNITKTFKKTGSVLHTTWSKTSDPVARQEILAFSAELTKMDSNITALGFYDINHSLILSMMAALIMYFLILIQADLKGGAQNEVLPLLRMLHFDEVPQPSSKS